MHKSKNLVFQTFFHQINTIRHKQHFMCYENMKYDISDDDANDNSNRFIETDRFAEMNETYQVKRHFATQVCHRDAVEAP